MMISHDEPPGKAFPEPIQASALKGRCRRVYRPPPAQVAEFDALGASPEIYLPGPCRRCHERRVKLRWQRWRNGHLALRASCWYCARFRGFIRLTPGRVAAAAGGFRGYPLLLGLLLDLDAAGVNVVSAAGNVVLARPARRLTGELAAGIHRHRRRLAAMLGRHWPDGDRP